MRKTAVFATVIGLCAATTLAALTTYQLVQLYHEKQKKNASGEAIPEAKKQDAVAVNTEKAQGKAPDLENIPADGAEKTDVSTIEEEEKEDLTRADDAGRDLCYYLPQSKIWHSDDTCAFIAGKKGVVTATVAKANAAGKMRGCSRCGA
jgi:hypothetical protein